MSKDHLSNPGTYEGVLEHRKDKRDLGKETDFPKVKSAGLDDGM